MSQAQQERMPLPQEGKLPVMALVAMTLLFAFDKILVNLLGPGGRTK